MQLRAPRAGYTLLEVVLAMTIGAVLMAALYTSLDLTLRHAQAGRDKVGQATVARSLITRITADIAPNLSPPVPAQAGSSGGAGGGAGTGAGGGAGAGAAQAGTSNTGASPNSGGGAAATSGAPIPGLNGTVTFNLGVQGDSSTLVLYTIRVPREVDAAYSGDAAPAVSDLRRITYWLTANNGLARQEIKVATSDDALNSPQPDPADEVNFVLAEEVRSLSFQYFDGSNWQDSWDGTVVPDGGSKPKGPPLAIAVTIGLVIPGSSTESGDPVLKTFRHVVAIPTANGTSQNSSSGTTSP